MLLFLHIEKCAGTTIISHFRNQLPYESIDVLTRKNKVCFQDIKIAKKLYAGAKVCSGHSITPDRIDVFEQLFGDVQTLSIIRDPIERVISNYVHDVRRGKWDADLSSYLRIPWKHNYLLRFLGGGRVEYGFRASEEIDFLLPVDQFEQCLPVVFESTKLNILTSLTKKNESSGTLMPKDVKIYGGVPVGIYCIREDEYDYASRVNKLDVEFWSSVKSNFAPYPIKEAGDGEVNSNTSRCKVRLASLYRNMIYKPMVLRQFGYHALPRNSQNPGRVSENEAFV